MVWSVAPASCGEITCGGKFDEKKNSLKIHQDTADGGDNLVDKAVVKTLLNGGEVHIVGPEDMPAESQMAAIFRY